MKDSFERSEIVSVLQGFNPWWSGRAFQVPDFKRLAYQACYSHLKDQSLHRAVLLSGPRRVGKTTILQQIAVANHLTLLEQANLVYRLPPEALGGKRVLKARNKYYLVDAALRNAVLLRGEEILTNPEEMGLIVETTILRHLYAYYYRDTPRLVYWRDAASGKEVDIIVRSPAYVLPFEVKYKEKASLEEDGGLATYCRSERPRQAYLVTKRDADFDVVKLRMLDTQVLKIPAHILSYLLGQSERLLWK